MEVDGERGRERERERQLVRLKITHVHVRQTEREREGEKRLFQNWRQNRRIKVERRRLHVLHIVQRVRSRQFDNCGSMAQMSK